MELKILYFNLVYVFLLSSKTPMYINKIHKVELKTLFQFSDVFSVLSRGNEKLLKSQRFTHRQSVNYLKIPKISPGAYFFQKRFFEGLIFGGAYLRRKFAYQNRMG